MELNLRKIANLIFSNNDKINKINEAKKYYKNESLILKKGVLPASENKDPLRSADNKIPHNFHEILVDEKASYMFTYPILIDIDNDRYINEKVNKILGEEFTRKIKNQCIEASNAGTSFLHYWIKETDNNKEFKYALVNSEEIIPIYENGLERDLIGIIRHYTVNEYVENSDELKPFKYVEYWTDKDMQEWKFENNTISLTGYIDYKKVEHNLKEIPFIEFANNNKKQSDLCKYKELIDLYDRVMSGFANDLDDIQEIIYILENYGGVDLQEFTEDLKKYKSIKIENDGTGSGGGVKTLQIEIPVEARKVILELLKKQIYESGQGLQQDVENFGNSSGVALKFFYRKLELKSGLLETEFRTSINKLIKAILSFLNIENFNKINQTWTRNMISNDTETATIAKESIGVIPTKIVLRNHPWVEDLEEALKMLEEEKKEQLSMYDDYSNLGEGE